MERGRSKGPQQRTVTALADALALPGDARTQLIELARDGRLRDHWMRPAAAPGELPRPVDDFTGRAAELAWVSEMVCAESSPGVGVVRLITGSAGLGKTTFAVRAAHALRPGFPDGVFFLDLFGMSQRPLAADGALRLPVRALGAPWPNAPGRPSARPPAATPSTSPARPSSPPSSPRPPRDSTARPRSDGAITPAYRTPCRPAATAGRQGRHRPGRLSAVAPELRS
jgi:hypothetical protein